jgi:hypothetical protein
MELRARARAGETLYYAATVVYCYGESGKFDPDAERVESAPEWPGFRLLSGGNFYRAQTGTPIFVECDPKPLSVLVFENQAVMATAWQDENGAFGYASPHDETLSKSGYTAKKDLVFEARLPGGLGVASFYIPVYRAFYGQTDIRGGLAILSSAVLISLGIVVISGRRFSPR